MHTQSRLWYNKLEQLNVVSLIPYLNNTQNPSYKTKYSIEGHQY